MRSPHRGPVTAEYNVTGNTYAPDGVILDTAGLKVNTLCIWQAVVVVAIGTNS